MVALVAAAYISWRLNWMDWHARIGYAALTTVLFRIVWGLVGSDTSRFARFVGSPRAALGHLRHAWRREPDAQPGHNPAGAWMVLLLLALLLAETATGLYVADDVADEGPLTALVPAAVANAITHLHRTLWDALLAAVALHVLAIVAYAVVKGQNLLRPMLTGSKRLPQSVPAPRLAGTLRAALVLGGCALAVAALARFL